MGMVGTAFNKYMMFTFGDWTTDFAKILCKEKDGLLRLSNGQSIWSKTKDAYKQSQALSLEHAGIKNVDDFSVSKYARGAIGSWGKEISEGAAKSESLIGRACGGTKALFKGVGKRLPLVGTVASLLFEIPNLYRSFTDKDGGVGTGTVETGKAAIKLGAFAGGAAAGAAIGTLIFPGVGTAAGAVIGFLGSVVGGIAAGWAADKVVGKSFTQKKEEAEAAEQAKQESTPQQQVQEHDPRKNPRIQQHQMQQMPIGPSQNPYVVYPQMTYPTFNAGAGLNPFSQESDVMSGF